MARPFPLSNSTVNPWRVASASGLSFLLVFGQTAPVLGNPTGGNVVAGNASIDAAGKTLNVNQGSQNAIINWQNFSINHGEATKFMVPNASSATLNRVVGGNLSAIYGTLQSNGKVFLVNPSGIVVGPTGRIDTAGFIGSTLNVTNDDFLKGGDLHFLGSSDGKINNAGVIKATGGDVYLIANEVKNSGQILATKGNVGLAAGTEVLLQQSGDQHLFIQSTPAGTKKARGVTNAGTIRAASSELTAAGGNAYALAINNTGHIAATGFKKVNGQVLLTADGGNISNSGAIKSTGVNRSGGKIVLDGHGTTSKGKVLNSGVLDASAKAKGKKGGTVKVLGNQVGITDLGVVDVSGDAGGGVALIGGDVHGTNPDVVNAEQSYLGKDAKIVANAIATGNGGKVVLWGNKSTQAYGKISVRGGATSGNGGFVETSGGKLVALTAPDLSAPHGQGGQWLLDPSTVTISDQGTDSGFDLTPAFTIPSASVVTITQATLLSALQSGDVTIDASQGTGTGAGTIRWIQPGKTQFDFNTVEGSTLRLLATGQISFDTIRIGSSSTSGSLNIELNSESQSGAVLLSKSEILLNGGKFTAYGTGVTTTVSTTGNINGINITGSSLDAQGGDISLTGTAGHKLGADSTLISGTGVQIVNGSEVGTKNDGAIDITGVGSAGTEAHPLTVTSNLQALVVADSSLAVQNGSLTLTGTVQAGHAGTAADPANAVGVVLRDDADITATGTGAVNLTGNTVGSLAYNDNNTGIDISSSEITVSNGGSLTLTGEAGNIRTDDSIGLTFPGSHGVVVESGTSIIANGNASISITGTGGNNQAIDGALTGVSTGVSVFAFAPGQVNSIKTGTGDITITGTAGKSPSQGTGILISGINGGSNTIGSSNGNIAITGTGGLGYTGSGQIVGTYVPNVGISITDDSHLITANSGSITLTGTGGANSAGVVVLELPPGSFDLSPSLPSIDAAGAFTATALSHTGVYLNASVLADSVTLGSGVSGDFSSITSGFLQIEDSSIHVVGNFNAFGAGFTSTTKATGLPDGIYIHDSSVSSQGGNLDLTGRAGYVKSGILVAGSGVHLSQSTLSTTGLGTISINARGNAGTGAAPVTVATNLIGFYAESDSSLKAVDGNISIIGSVNAGHAGIQAAGVMLSSTFVTSSGIGAIQITGSAKGSAAALSSAGIDLVAARLGSASTFGDAITLTGIAGTLASTGQRANGVQFENSSSLQVTAGNIRIVGTGGVVLPGSQSQAVANGISINSISDEFNEISSFGPGSISLVGIAGSSPYSAAGISIDASAGGSNSITAQGGNISLTGSAPFQSGTASDSIAGVTLTGFSTSDANTIRAETGSVTIVGSATSGTSSQIAGISIRDTFEVYGGNGVSLTGTAAGSTSTGVSGGVYIAYGKVTALGSNGLTITGTGGQLIDSRDQDDLLVANPLLVPPTTAGILVIDESQLTTSPLESPMTLTGIGGVNSNTSEFSGSFGVFLVSPRLDQTTSLTGSDLPITITGTGGASVGHSIGVLIGGPANYGSVTITGAQVINITGTSGVGVADSEQPDAGIVIAAASGTVEVNSYYGQISLTGTASAAPGFGVIVQDDSKLIGNGLSIIGTGAGDVGEVLGVLADSGFSDSVPLLNAGSGALSVLSNFGGLSINAGYGGSTNTFTSPLGTLSSIENAVGPLSLFGGDFYIDPEFGIDFDQVSVHDLTVLDGGATFKDATVHNLTVAGDGFVSTGTITADSLNIVVEGIISLGTTNVATSTLLDAGEISQTGALSTPILNIAGTKGDYTVNLTNAGNHIAAIPLIKGGNVDIATNQSVLLHSTITENFKITSGGNLTLGTTTATTALQLGAAGLISQTGSIVAGSLSISRSENTFLSNGDNSIEAFGNLYANNNLSLYNTQAINLPKVQVGGELILSTPGAISTGLATANSIFLQPGGNVFLGQTVATESLTIDPIISDLHYPGISVQQEGTLTTGKLSILGEGGKFTDSIAVNDVILTNSGNRIGSLGDIYHNGEVAITSSNGLKLEGSIYGFDDVTLKGYGDDLTIGFLGNINAVGNVTLVTDHNFINQVIFGTAINIDSAGSYYYIYAADFQGSRLGNLRPTVTQFNTTFPAQPLPEANAVFYASSPRPPRPPEPPAPPIINTTTPEMVQAVITPQASQVAPQQVPPSRPGALDAGDIFLPVSYTGNGGINPIGTGVLADAYGNGGSVGSGDMVQIGGGGLNNSSNPAAAAALDNSLSPIVRSNLDDALKGITSVTYAPVTTTSTEDQTSLTAGTGGGNAEETIIGPGETALVGNSGVKPVPANQVPQELQDALSPKVRNSLPER